MSEELKPCPCCGFEAELYEIKIYMGNPEYFIRCRNSECPIETKQWLGKENVIKPWNTRTTDSKYEKLIAFIKELKGERLGLDFDIDELLCEIGEI